MFIQTEHTPNPSTLKFVPGKVVMKKGTANFQNKETATNSPLAKKIFEIEGVKSIFFGSDFITITKIDTTEWEVIKPMILGSIADYFKSNNPIFDTNENLDDTKQEEIPANQDNKIVKQKVSSDFAYYYSPALFNRSKKYLLEKIQGDYLGETIFLHGGQDKAVPYGYNDKFNLSKKFKNFKNILIKHADHSLSDKESLKTLSKFI